jgi:hypothetical protein
VGRYVLFHSDGTTAAVTPELVPRAYKLPREGRLKGAAEDKARKAAETVAAYENRFSRLETDLTVLKWMVGFNLAATLGILMLLLRQQSL